MSNTIHSVEEITALLHPVFSEYNINKAILFGSYSKNTATEKSDVDLCVDSGLRGLKFVGLIESLKNALGGKEVDVLDVTHIEKGSRVEREVEKTGVQIYEK